MKKNENKNYVFVVTNKGNIVAVYNRNEIVNRCKRNILDDEDALFGYVEDMGWEDIEVYPYEYAYYEDGSIDWANTRSVLKHDGDVYMVAWGKEIDSFLANHIIWLDEYSELYYVGKGNIMTIPLGGMYDEKDTGLVIYNDDECCNKVWTHIYNEVERETVELLRMEREFCSQVGGKIRQGVDPTEMEKETPFGTLCVEKINGNEVAILIYKVNEYGEKYDWDTVKIIPISK